MSLSITVQGNGVKRFKALAWELGSGKARKVYSRAINDSGNKRATATGKALADAANVKRPTGRKALKQRRRSTPSTLEFSIHVRGGAIRYKYFKGTKETRKGVSVAPRGERTIMKRHFLKAGWHPTRIDKTNWNGHVMTVTGNNKSGVTVARSDVFLPEEVVQGEPAQEFDKGNDHLNQRVSHYLKRIAGGAFS